MAESRWRVTSENTERPRSARQSLMARGSVMESLHGVWLAVGSVLLLPVLFFFLVIWQWRHPRIYWKLSKFPSFCSVPLVGDTLFLSGKTNAELLDILKDIQERLRFRYVKGILLGIPSITLYHPDDIEVILANTTNISKGYEYFCLKPWLREGLLLSDGSKWRERRKLLTPTFHFKILEDNVGQVYQHSKVFIDKLLAFEGKPISLDDLVKKYTLDVICETAMGVKMNAQENESVHYMDAVTSAAHTSVKRVLELWLLREWIFKLTEAGKKFFEALDILHNFTKKVINERKQERSKTIEKPEKGKKKKAFLDMLLDTEEQNPGIFTPLDIQEEVDTFMFEGHDTTSSAINFALYCLGTNLDVQEEVLEEQRRIFGDEEREPTIQDLQDMTYLEMVIKEVLRLYPPVPFFSRTLSKDTVLGQGEVLPAGTSVSIFPFLVHRHHDFWDDPEEFRPERFLPGTGRHPFSYIPFSAGPRNCIGMKFAMMELKTTLSAVVRSCLIEPVTVKPAIMPALILRTYEPIEIRATSRK